jgi:hypothetical protein
MYFACFCEEPFHRQGTGKHPLLVGEGYHVLDIVLVLLSPW